MYIAADIIRRRINPAAIGAWRGDIEIADEEESQDGDCIGDVDAAIIVCIGGIVTGDRSFSEKEDSDDGDHHEQFPKLHAPM